MFEPCDDESSAQLKPMRAAFERNSFSASGVSRNAARKSRNPYVGDAFLARGDKRAGFVEPPGGREAIGGDSQDMNMRVGTGRGLEGPFRSVAVLTEPRQRDCTGRQHGELQRIEGAQVPRIVRRFDGPARVAPTWEWTNPRV